MLRTILFLLATLITAVVLSAVLPFEVRAEQVAAFQQVTPVFVALTLLAFAVGELTGNHSQVDKLWSVVPAVYAWSFAACSDWSPRLVLVSAGITLWAVRLSLNFARRGGFGWPPWRGVEDYRWAGLRENELFAGHPGRFRLFHLFFICG